LGQDPSRLPAELAKILAGNAKTGAIPPQWDGCAAERIADVLENAFLI
jgi:hypothetical protein